MQPTLFVSKNSLKKLIHEYKYLLALIFGLAIAWITEPAFAQCLGWMCGPKTAISNNQVINGNNTAPVFIEFIFLTIQVLILLALGALIVTFFWKMDRDENYIKPLVALLVALLLIFGSNFIGGYIVGDGSTGSANNNPSGVTQAGFN
jgi:hypothetical protein